MTIYKCSHTSTACVFDGRALPPLGLSVDYMTMPMAGKHLLCWPDSLTNFCWQMNCGQLVLWQMNCGQLVPWQMNCGQLVPWQMNCEQLVLQQMDELWTTCPVTHELWTCPATDQLWTTCPVTDELDNLSCGRMSWCTLLFHLLFVFLTLTWSLFLSLLLEVSSGHH